MFVCVCGVLHALLRYRCVHKATGLDPWGPTGSEMTEIAELTKRDYDTYREVMGQLYRRMTEVPVEGTEQWRHCYKSLLIIDFLIKHGSPRVIDELRRDAQVLQALKNFKFVDAKGHDKGINIRQRSAALLELLDDVDAIKEERAKARKNKDKYKGVSSEDVNRRATSTASFDDRDDWDGGATSTAAEEPAPAAAAAPPATTSAANPSSVRELNDYYSDDLVGDLNTATAAARKTTAASASGFEDDFGDFSDAGAAPVAAAEATKKLSDTKVTVSLNNGVLAPPSSTTAAPAAPAGMDMFGDFGDTSGAAAAAPVPTSGIAAAAADPFASMAAPSSSGGAADPFASATTSVASVGSDLFGSETSGGLKSATGSSSFEKTALDVNSLYGAANTPARIPGVGGGFAPAFSGGGPPQVAANPMMMGGGMGGAMLQQGFTQQQNPMMMGGMMNPTMQQPQMMMGAGGMGQSAMQQPTGGMMMGGSGGGGMNPMMPGGPAFGGMASSGMMLPPPVSQPVMKPSQPPKSAAVSSDPFAGLSGF